MKQILFFLTFFILSPLHADERKPNVVLILIDDFGYECVTGNGGESYKTPVMDKLAATGVRFEQCHAQPLCTPTRAQLMTGMGNRRNYTQFGHLDLSQKTFGNILKGAGYATCITGKWQLAGDFAGPAHFGFDEYALWQLNRRPGRYKNPGLEINGKQIDFTKNEYGPDIVNDYALDFITRKKDEPFLLYYPMMLTHGPYDATPDSPDYLENKAAKSNGPLGHFPDMVAYTDKLIGTVIAKLEELKLRDNTIILILGDNGTGKGMPSRFKGREVIGGKSTSTMWGTHVPGIGSWPGHFASGKVNADMIDTTDFLPTICEAVDVKVPTELKIDGRSFLPQLRGEKGNPRDALYVWYNPTGGEKAVFEFAHDQNYKLYADGKFYHTAKDDLEKSPLAADSLDETAKAAKVKLQALLDQHKDPRPDFFVKKGKAYGLVSGLTADTSKAATPAAQPAESMATRFEGRDLNHDGKLSWEEFQKTATDKDGAKARFAMFDTDKDGIVSREEFLKNGK
jgi:arylsulfatase A